MAKSKRSERELSKRDMSRIWGYLDTLQMQYQDKSMKVTTNTEMDGKRRRVLASDYLSRLAELDELKKALTVAIDACGDDDDDDY